MKMKEKKPKKPHMPQSIEDQTFFAASASDCTGLIPSAPVNQDEKESYNQLYNFYPEAMPEPADDGGEK